jgi:hypothetical protein
MGKKLGRGAHRARQTEMTQNYGERADRDANRRKQNRRRQFQAGRQRFAYTDNNQQNRNDEQYKSGIEHGEATASFQGANDTPDACNPIMPNTP